MSADCPGCWPTPKLPITRKHTCPLCEQAMIPNEDGIPLCPNEECGSADPSRPWYSNAE